jgi:hypothetical protein
MIAILSKSVALQLTITAVAIFAALVPISMSLGILAWGGPDRIIVFFLLISALATCGLVFKLVATESTSVIFQQVGLVSACAIAVVTLVYLVEFLFFRAPGVRSIEEVPVFGLSIPLVVLYGFSLISLSLEAFLTFQRIQHLKSPEVTPWPQ